MMNCYSINKKNQFYKKCLILLIFISSFSNYSFSQIYVSDSLKSIADEIQKEKQIDTELNSYNSDSVIFDNKHFFDYSILSDNSYELKVIKLVNIEGNYTESQLNMFINEIENELQLNNLIIDLDSKYLYRIHRNNNTFYYYNIVIDDSQLFSENCKSCQDNAFKIIELSDNTIILELKPQDEDKQFTYQFELSKII